MTAAAVPPAAAVAAPASNARRVVGRCNRRGLGAGSFSCMDGSRQPNHELHASYGGQSGKGDATPGTTNSFPTNLLRPAMKEQALCTGTGHWALGTGHSALGTRNPPIPSAFTRFPL